MPFEAYEDFMTNASNTDDWIPIGRNKQLVSTNREDRIGKFDKFIRNWLHIWKSQLNASQPFNQINRQRSTDLFNMNDVKICSMLPKSMGSSLAID